MRHGRLGFAGYLPLAVQAESIVRLLSLLLAMDFTKAAQAQSPFRPVSFQPQHRALDAGSALYIDAPMQSLEIKLT